MVSKDAGSLGRQLGVEDELAPRWAAGEGQGPLLDVATGRETIWLESPVLLN